MQIATQLPFSRSTYREAPISEGGNTIAFEACVLSFRGVISFSLSIERCSLGGDKRRENNFMSASIYSR